MTQLTAVQAKALQLVVGATLDAIKAAGSNGAPAGVIYAGLMAQGCRKEQFDSLMSALVRTGKITHDPDAHLYFIAGGAS